MYSTVCSRKRLFCSVQNSNLPRLAARRKTASVGKPISFNVAISAARVHLKEIPIRLGLLVVPGRSSKAPIFVCPSHRAQQQPRACERTSSQRGFVPLLASFLLSASPTAPACVHRRATFSERGRVDIGSTWGYECGGSI